MRNQDIYFELLLPNCPINVDEEFLKEILTEMADKLRESVSHEDVLSEDGSVYCSWRHEEVTD